MEILFKKTFHSAFTLIELVITIVVIGILSAALIATYSSLSESAKKAAQQASLSSLQSQIAIHLGASPIHQFPTMLELQDEVPDLLIATNNINPNTTTNGLKTAVINNISSAFALYPSNDLNQRGSTHFIFYINTTAGAVVLLPFADSFCKYPLGLLPTVAQGPADAATTTTQTSKPTTAVSVSTVTPGASVAPTTQLTINGGTDGTTLTYSLNEYMSANPSATTYPTAPSGAVVQCVRMANTSEINQNFNLISGFGVSAQ